MTEPSAPDSRAENGPEKRSDGGRPGGERRPRRRFGRLRRFVLRPLVWGGALSIVLLASLLGFLGSATARSRAAALVTTRLSELLGRPVRLGGVDFGFLPLEVELVDLTIPGDRAGEPPFAEIPRLRVRLSWRALRDRVLDFSQISASRPVVRLEFRADGSSNLPEIRAGGGGRSRFTVRIDRILVEDGTLVVAERTLPLDLSARAVWGRLVGPDPERLTALATAQEVEIVLPDARPYLATASVRGLVEPGQVTIESYRLAGPDLALRGDGGYRWGKGTFEVGITARGRADVALVNRWGYLADPIAGAVELSARVDANRDSWGWQGEFTAPRVSYLGREATAIAARGRGDGAKAEIDIQTAEYAGGTLAGTVGVDLRPKGPAKPIAIDLAFENLDARRFLAAEGLDLDLSSRGAGTFRYAALADDLLAGDGDVALRLSGTPTGGRGLSVAGDLPLEIERGVLSTPGFRLTGPAILAEGSATFDLARSTGTVQARLSTEDLAAAARVIPTTTTPAESHDAPEIWRPLAGRGSARVGVEIASERWAADVSFDLEDVRSPALAADSLVGSLVWHPDRIEELDVVARQAGARLAVAGRVPLAADDRGLGLTIAAAGWPLADLTHLVPGLPAASGRATGDVSLAGSFSDLSGRADVTVADLSLAGRALGQATASVAFAGPRLMLERALVTAPGGVLQASGSIDRATGALSLAAEAPALDFGAEPFRSLIGLSGLAGKGALHLAVAGTLDHPEASATARATALALDGRPLGNAGSAQLVAHWDGETFEGHGSLLGLVTFAGGGRLDRAGADLDFSLESSNLRGLADVAAAGLELPEIAGGFSGRTRIGADFSTGAFDVALDLPRLDAQVAGRRIKNLEPISIRLADDRLTIGSLYLGEAATGSDLFASGTVGLDERGSLDLRFQSTLAASWAEVAVPELEVAGSFDAIGTIRGTLDRPAIRGEGELREARLLVPNFPNAVEDLRGTVSFNRDEIVLDGLRARLGGGDLRASGRIAIPERGKELDYALQFLAEDLSLRYPTGFLSRGDAEITLASVRGGRQLRGEVRLDRAYYLEDVEVGTLELLTGALRRSRFEVEDADPFLASTALALKVTGPGALRVRNNVADVHGDIDLSLRGSAARPVVFGSVEIQEGGKLRYADNEYRIERGRITFDNPNRIDPVIDLTARTEVKSYAIALDLSGTLERLDARFRSEDGLADLDILSLLATGREFDRNAGAGGTLGGLTGSDSGAPTPGGSGRAAEFLAGQAASAVSQRVRNLFGFDRFRIDPLAGANDSLSGVQVTVGKRLSKKLFVTYTSSPSSTEPNLIQAEWQVGDNVVLLLSSNGTGRFSIDAQWEKRF